MLSNLPDDVRESDPRAPWNEPELPVAECKNCGAVYDEGGSQENDWNQPAAAESHIRWVEALVDEELRYQQPHTCPVCDPVGHEACPACQTPLQWADDAGFRKPGEPPVMEMGPSALACPDCGCTEAFVT